MEQSASCEPNSSLASPEIPRLFLDQKVHYHFHNSLPLLTILRHINLVHAFPSCFFKVQFSTILPSTVGSFKWSLSFRFPHQNLVCISLRSICVTRPTNLKNTAVMALTIYCLSLYRKYLYLFEILQWQI